MYHKTECPNPWYDAPHFEIDQNYKLVHGQMEGIFGLLYSFGPTDFNSGKGTWKMVRDGEGDKHTTTFYDANGNPFVKIEFDADGKPYNVRGWYAEI